MAHGLLHVDKNKLPETGCCTGDTVKTDGKLGNVIASG
jgi:hypothetical protein